MKHEIHWGLLLFSVVYSETLISSSLELDRSSLLVWLKEIVLAGPESLKLNSFCAPSFCFGEAIAELLTDTFSSGPRVGVCFDS